MRDDAIRQAFLIGFCPTVAANLNSFDAAELTKVIVAYSEWPGEVSTDSGQHNFDWSPVGDRLKIIMFNPYLAL